MTPAVRHLTAEFLAALEAHCAERTREIVADAVRGAVGELAPKAKRGRPRKVVR